VLSKSAVVELVHDSLYPMYRSEKSRLDHIDLWYRWEHERLSLPRNATDEHKTLADLARTPWLGLVVTTVAQCMYVDGVKSPTANTEAAWARWRRNRMSSRQIALHRAALAYGHAYALVLPGEPHAVIRGVSPRKMVAAYADPAWDDWPLYAMEVADAPGGAKLATVYDGDGVGYRVQIGGPEVPGSDDVAYIADFEHGAENPPVVRYTNMLDLDGRTPGEVEPFISVAQRVNKSAFDRLLAQHFNSWKIRTIAGLSKPESVDGLTPEEAARRQKIRLQNDSILIASDPDTKFGTLDETPLSGLIDAEGKDIETLAAVTQTPTNALTGQLANLNADGITAARAGLTQKVHERQMSIGESHVQTLQLAALLDGDTAVAEDVELRVSWQDTEIRSMNAAVDALGKAAQMLNVPPQALWGRIPGFEQSDADEWLKMLGDMADVDPVGRLGRGLDRQTETAA
jgi:hypothetical protein